MIFFFSPAADDATDGGVGTYSIKLFILCWLSSWARFCLWSRIATANKLNSSSITISLNWLVLHYTDDDAWLSFTQRNRDWNRMVCALVRNPFSLSMMLLFFFSLYIFQFLSKPISVAACKSSPFSIGITHRWWPFFFSTARNAR